MKAAQISEYGGPSVVKVNAIDRPSLEPNKVLVEVHAASLNPFDTTVREGHVAQMIKSLPTTLGGDIAGVVTELGSEVSGFKVGDKVYGQAGVVAGNSGAFAEFVATKANHVARMPENLDFVEAASLPLVGVSAVDVLTNHIKLKKGQNILIHGGTGGIGTAAIQLAKHMGAYVATTVPGNAVERASDLGADEVIDYQTQNFEDFIHGYDAVFDTAGGDVLERSLGILKAGGIAVSMTASVDEATAKERNVTAITQQTRVNTEALNQLTKLVVMGVIKPQVAETFPLEQIAEAFTTRENGGVNGKVVLKIKAD